MTDDITGERLKKKVLDRWENEGGRILADPTRADKSSPTSDHEGEGDLLSASLGDSAVGTPASPTKKLKTTKK